MLRSGCVVVTVVGAPDPAVDVVPAVLPVAGHDLVARVDAIEPLDRLVAVHGRHVEPDGTAVRVRQLLSLQLVGDQHVVAARLLQREALGVRAVEGAKPQRLGGRLYSGAIEHVGEPDAPPLHVEDAPPRHALEVAGEAGRRHRAQVLVGERERLVDEPADVEPVLVVAPVRHRPRDRVDAEASDGQEAGQACAVLGQVRAHLLLEPALRVRPPQDPGRAHAQEPEEHPPSDRRAVHALRIRTRCPDRSSGAGRSRARLHRISISSAIHAGHRVRTPGSKRVRSIVRKGAVMSLVKLLPAWFHASADYAVGGLLIVVALGVGGSAGAIATGVGVGAVVLLVSMLTRYPLGVLKVLPFTVHSAGDYLAATLLIVAPFALNFWSGDTGLSIFYIIGGVAVLAVSLITNYQYSPKRELAGAAPVTAYYATGRRRSGRRSRPPPRSRAECEHLGEAGLDGLGELGRVGNGDGVGVDPDAARPAVREQRDVGGGARQGAERVH